MQNHIEIKCPAKINLGIDVIDRLPNGYHRVRMVMSRVRLFDTVRIELSGDKAITLSGSDKDMPLDNTNLAYRAAESFFGALDDPRYSDLGCHIDIEKCIPSGAGMAGGSADAAGVINGLNALLGEPLTQNEREKLGLALGADVPYCIHGGTALAEGIGEILTPLPDPPECAIVIAKPRQSISTKWVYEHLDLSKKPAGLNIDGLTKAIRKNDLTLMYECMGNVLENATVPVCPEVAIYKDSFMSLGADIAMMSGSGSSVFALCGDKENAKYVYKSFSALHPDAAGVWLV